MENNFSFSYSGLVEQTINGSGNTDQYSGSFSNFGESIHQELSRAFSGLRGNIQQELTSALSDAGVSDLQDWSHQWSHKLSKSIEEQFSEAIAGVRLGEMSNTCEYVTMPSGSLVQLSCVAPDVKSILSLTAEEYCTIEKEMQASIVEHVHCASAGGCFSKYVIVKIQKILNSEVYEQYMRVRSEVVAEHGQANEHMLFHGSPHIPEVMQTGFNTAHASPDGLFGAGIYFAKHSSKSNQYVFGHMGGAGCPAHADKNCYECERQILLCRVVLGRVYEVTKDQGTKQVPAGYHSVKGVPGEGGDDGSEKGLRYPEYVVYKGKQAYPEYVITYKIAQ